ncbi:MAG: 16S rRNA (adenine(1518)-N(6)/adenine(1519)-N(6))-dimethyltransferase RsmA [Gemmatimonadales bacterium]
MGQHFLTDPRILGRIADALGSTEHDTVIEIGAGRGALTGQLVVRCARVIAIEVDRALGAGLRDRFAGDARVEVVERDVLDVEFGAAAGGGPFLLVGNIPYNITTPILFHALERPRPARAVFLVQREVAERVVAGPGTEAYGALSANLQAVAGAELLFRVAAGAFTPPPRVESAVLRVTPLESPVIEAGEEKPFRTMVVGAFGFRRKQMVRVVRELWALDAGHAAALLAEAHIDPRARPEVLSPSDFARLLRARQQRL